MANGKLRDRTAAAGGVVVLAGGLSARMGRDKAAVRLAGEPLVRHAVRAGLLWGRVVRVLRRDAVPRCGPLGGLYTGLLGAGSDRVLFLSCDMPFVGRLVSEWSAEGDLLGGRLSCWAAVRGRPGFPVVLDRSLLGEIGERIRGGRLALRDLAAASGRLWDVPAGREWELMNVNTPEDLELAEARAGRLPADGCD